MSHQRRRLTLILITSALCAPLLSCSDSSDGQLDGIGSGEKGYYLSTSLWSGAQIPVCWEDITTISDSDRECGARS